MIDDAGKQGFLENAKALERLFDKSELSFNDAVVISGIDARQLRNGLDRGSLKIGSRLRVGRWVFTLRECFELLIIAQLGNRAWVPVSQAADIAAQVAPHTSNFFNLIHHMGGELGETGTVRTILELVCFNNNGQPRVVLHKRGGDDWGFFNLSGERLELQSWQLPHIRMPVLGLTTQLLGNYALAMGNDLPPGVIELDEQQRRAADGPEGDE